MYAETEVTVVVRLCLDRVRLVIDSSFFTTGECSVWERMRWAIGALTIRYRRIEPFGLLKLSWTSSTLLGGGGGLVFPRSPL